MLNRLAPSSAASRAAARKSSPMRSRAATPQRVRFGRLGSRALRLERMRGEGDTLLVPHLVDPWIAPPPTRHVAALPVPRARPRRRLPRTSLLPARGREHIPTSLRARASPAACDGRRADADEDARKKRLPLSPSLSRPRPNPSPRLHHSPAETRPVTSVAPKQQQQQPQALQRLASGALAAALAAAALSGAALLPTPSPAHADFRLPPIDRKNTARCEDAYTGNTIGQANAVSNSVLDLRECSLKKADLRGKTLSGALMSDADFSDADMTEAVLTKAYIVKSKFVNANLTNAVIDRVVFDGADLSGAKLINAVVTGSTFEGATLTDTNWEDALIGSEDVKRLCLNPTLTGESRFQVGCRS